MPKCSLKWATFNYTFLLSIGCGLVLPEHWHHLFCASSYNPFQLQNTIVVKWLREYILGHGLIICNWRPCPVSLPHWNHCLSGLTGNRAHQSPSSCSRQTHREGSSLIILRTQTQTLAFWGCHHLVHPELESKSRLNKEGLSLQMNEWMNE